MQLKDFVREALVQISMGVTEANRALADSDAVVNPGNVELRNTSGVFARVKDPQRKNPIVNLVEFDVAVYAGKESSGEGGGGISVLSIQFGAKKKADKSAGSVSRIRFGIPLLLPSENPPPQGDK